MKKYILNKIDSKDLKQPTFVISDLSHNQNINFHPGVTLAVKESDLSINVTPSGFWYKL